MHWLSHWDSIPFSPKRFPFYYGWVIVVVAIFGLLMSLPGQTMGVAVYTDPLLTRLGINRMQLSACYMVGTIFSALMLPSAGRLYDRAGARVMTPIAAVGLAITLVMLSRISTIVASLNEIFPDSGLWQSLIAISFCFSFLRFFGQGMLTMLPRNMAMKWFVRRRGLVNGFFGLSVAFGFSTLTYLLNLMVETLGFEVSLLYVAIFIGLGFSTVAIVFFRDSPESFDLLPDGIRSSVGDSAVGSGVIEDGATLTKAKGYFEFWIYCVAPAFAAMSITATSFHIVSIFEAAGYQRSQAVAVFIPTAVVSAVMTIFLGWISDRARICNVLRLICFAQLVFFSGLLLLEVSFGYWLLVLGMGLSQSSFGILLGLSWPRLFGVLHLGEISGFAMSITVFGSAIGPLLFGLSYHYTGSYYLTEAILGGLAIILLLCSLRAKS